MSFGKNSWHGPQLVWKPVVGSYQGLGNGVEVSRWLNKSEPSHLIDWCVEHFGPSHPFQVTTDISWVFLRSMEVFFFRREADMVMFVLANTIAG